MATMLDFSTPHLLRDGEEYAAARRALLALLDRDPEPGTPDHEELEFLTVLIAAYDDVHSVIGRDTVSPQDAVRFALDQRGWTRADLAPVLGGKARVSEFFAGKRPLSMTQVRALREHLSLPADLLIHPVHSGGPVRAPGGIDGRSRGRPYAASASTREGGRKGSGTRAVKRPTPKRIRKEDR